jgi:catechol 2,3-dioxygenase-like lactoylglutathione lyase family enzyme
MKPRSLSLCCLFILPAALARGEDRAHFHHVHLNVTNVEESLRFYARVFGAVPIKYRGTEDALFTERSFLFLDRVAAPPPSALASGIWHIGWGGVDVKSEFAWWQGRGVSIHTPLSPLPGPDNYYFYISGPDKELIEINTMGHHRFGHVHLFATDVNETTRWYAEHLGLQPRRPLPVPKPDGDMSTFASIWINAFACDNVNLIVFGKPDRDPPPAWWPDPPLRTLAPTRGRAIDHIAFSYPDIAPVYRRMTQAGARVVAPIAVVEPLGLKSFFVLAPDDVLVEIVEAPPLPDAAWQGRSELPSR